VPEERIGDETEFLTAIEDDAPLPFKPGPARPLEPGTPAAHVGDGPLTGATEHLTVDAIWERPLPFVTAPPMDPERYAELVARSDGMPPGVVKAIHAEHGVSDEGQRQRLDADMARFFADHADERLKF